MQIKQEKGHYTLYKESEAIGTAVVDGAAILRLEIVPAWRGRGYGSYLVKELLRRGGGLDPKQATRFTAPLPRDEAGRALARRFDFVAEGGRLVRRRVPDLSAVELCHEFLELHVTPGGLYLDATCGNGNDTLFLCRLAGQNGRVLAMDIQQKAVDRTNRRLTDAGYEKVGRAVLYDHAKLGNLCSPARWIACCSTSAGCRGPSTPYIPRRRAVFPPCVPRWMPCAPAVCWRLCCTAARS